MKTKARLILFLLIIIPLTLVISSCYFGFITCTQNMTSPCEGVYYPVKANMCDNTLQWSYDPDVPEAAKDPFYCMPGYDPFGGGGTEEY